MKSKSIYVLRHGETDFNKKGLVQGRGVDVSLNEEGRRQAESAHEALQLVNFDQLYASSLKRSQETIAPFQRDYISDAGFDEISWGNQEGVPATEDAEKLYFQTVQNWRDGQLDLNIGGGESPLQVMKRQQEAMKKVLESDASQILICMHGRALRILLCWLLNYPLNFMDGFPHQNCCYYSLNYSGESFVLRDFNRTEHLHG